MTKEVIRKYLTFLEEHASNIISKDIIHDDDMRSVNLEVNKLTARMSKAKDQDTKLIDALTDLKLDYDELKPEGNRGLISLILHFGFFGWICGGATASAAEKRKSEIRKRNIEEFRSQLRNIWLNRNDYELLKEV